MKFPTRSATEHTMGDTKWTLKVRIREQKQAEKRGDPKNGGHQAKIGTGGNGKQSGWKDTEWSVEDVLGRRPRGRPKKRWTDDLH